MQYLGTISSKRQLTIPAALLKETEVGMGSKVLITKLDSGIKIEPAVNLVEELAGSVKIPAKYKGMQIDQIVTKAKQDYFRHNK